jgi:Tn3 transposase DDE domain
MLKEVDLRIHFTEQFATAGAREHLDRLTLQKRLLLCLYALGTDTGLKRMSGGERKARYLIAGTRKERSLRRSPAAACPAGTNQ